MFGFEKSDKDNIAVDEQRGYKLLARCYIALTDAELTLATGENILFEVNCHEENV